MRLIKPHTLWAVLLVGLIAMTACAPASLPATDAPSPAVRSTPAGFASATPTESPLARDSGSLRSRIDRFLEQIPQQGSNTYVIPSSADRKTFTDLVDALLAGNYSDASRLAASVDYQITDYSDQGDQAARDYLLEENLPIRNGWGWYAFRADPANHLIIEAPHPIADVDTNRVALDMYRAVDARALLIAGAHRDANDDGSADVSHMLGTIFEVVQASLARHPLATDSAVIVLQVHGFDSKKHPTYPDVVLGYDRKAANGALDQVMAFRSALIAAGFKVGVCDGKSWEALCGTTDVTRSVLNGFAIHIELNESIRGRDRAFIKAFAQAFRQP